MDELTEDDDDDDDDESLIACRPGGGGRWQKAAMITRSAHVELSSDTQYIYSRPELRSTKGGTYVYDKRAVVQVLN